MVDYMFPADPPQAPGEFVDALMADGGAGFMNAMGDGMEAFATAMNDGGDMASAGDAFMSTMTDACANGDVPGMSPEMFEAAAESFADVAGPALMTMQQDAGPVDMAEAFGDAADMMLPPDMEMPPEMGDMFSMMADTMGDCDCGPHDMGEAFGPDMPEGFVPGEPGTLPEGDFMAAPGDAGEMGEMGEPGPMDAMVPPDPDGTMMSDDNPMDGGPAPMDGPGPMVPPDPDGTMMTGDDGDGGMPGGPGPMVPPDPDGTMLSGDGPMDGGAADALGGAIGGAADALGGALGGADALGGALGGAPAPMDAGAAADAAIGAAMDGAMAQGGPADGSTPGPDPMAGTGMPADMPEDHGPEDDPTAGMA